MKNLFRYPCTLLIGVLIIQPCSTAYPEINISSVMKYALYCSSHTITTVGTCAVAGVLGVAGGGIGIGLAQYPPFDTWASPYMGMLSGFLCGLPLVYKAPKWTNYVLYKLKILTEIPTSTTQRNLVSLGARLLLVLALYNNGNHIKSFYSKLY